MKRFLKTMILTLALSLFIAFPALAAEVPAPISIENPGIVSPMAEQTQWYFRWNEDGQLQKRLWSLTYQKWLTDWIDVETVS